MEDNSIRLLKSYGLDHLITAQDDLHLWFAAVNKHWPKINEPNQPFPGVLFGVGRIKRKEEDPGPSGMEMIQEWLLIRTYGSQILPLPIEHKYASYLFPEHILQVSRPSVSQATAIVHAGSNPAPLSGSGEARIWEHQADGSWIETEVITRWIS